jgi:Ankyrin repeats (3 copies)
MNDTPPPDDAGDDLEALYRTASARDASQPNAMTRRAILEHSLRVSISRSPTKRTPWSGQSGSSGAPVEVTAPVRFSIPKWRLPVFVGSIAVAALAGLLIGPQFLHPMGPPITLPIAPKSAVPEMARSEPPQVSGPAAAVTSEPAAVAVNLPATAPTRKVLTPATLAASNADVAQVATTNSVASGSSEPGVIGGISVASTDASAEVTVTGSRVRRAPGTTLAAAAASTSPEARAGDSSARARVPDAGKPIDAKDSEGRTALMLAVVQGHLDAVRDLLRQGADPNAADASGVTPLQAARAANRPEIADVLLQAGAR